jgi:hypothetical protein
VSAELIGNLGVGAAWGGLVLALQVRPDKRLDTFGVELRQLSERAARLVWRACSVRQDRRGRPKRQATRRGLAMDMGESRDREILWARREATVRTYCFVDMLRRYRRRQQLVRAAYWALSVAALCAAGQADTALAAVFPGAIVALCLWSAGSRLDAKVMALAHLRAGWDRLRCELAAPRPGEGPGGRFRALRRRAIELEGLARSEGVSDPKALERWERFVDGWPEEGEGRR